MNRLFVYGIFLSEYNRNAYGMSNPEYTTVRDYLTTGGVIATAHKCIDAGLVLTGLTVDVNPLAWESIDALEQGYNRVRVVTTNNESVYMYAGEDF